jgi:adenylosuccinate lyase
LNPKAYIGRAPQQVDEFIRSTVTPIRKKYQRELNRKVELKV